MNKLFALVIVLLAAFYASAQKPDEVLATATGHTIKLADLTPETQKAVEGMPAAIAKARGDILSQMILERVLDAEAKALNKTSSQLLHDEKAKAPAPTGIQIKSVYDANREALGDKTLEQSRKQIVAFLRNGPEQKLIEALFEKLKTKYSVTIGKDVNSANLAAIDTVATIGGKAVSGREYSDFAKFTLEELRTQYAEVVLSDVIETLVNLLILDEAKSLNMDASAYIAREVTDKMKEFSDDERNTLLDVLQTRLFAKYKASILYKLPAPIVMNISVDDDPATGPAGAPVTIVMFTDFQCSACSATHPLLKKAMAMFPGKIRFVVRDFPLESIHENGFNAALAAGAANLQSKFFEYTEALYTHQDALDIESLKKYAVDLGLNVKQFEIDFKSEKIAAEVRKDMADGDSYGINATPTIYVNGVKVRDTSVNGFKAAIERALKK